MREVVVQGVRRVSTNAGWPTGWLYFRMVKSARPSDSASVAAAIIAYNNSNNNLREIIIILDVIAVLLVLSCNFRNSSFFTATFKNSPTGKYANRVCEVV
jgi:hypothetical protein